MALDGYTLAFLVKELDHQLTGSRVDKIYQPNKNELNIALRGTNIRGVSLIISADASLPFIATATTKGANPLQPPMFTMLLRKHLQGARLEKIRQHGLERVIIFDFLTRDELGDEYKLSLVTEIMGKHSNIILMETDSFKILDSIKRIPEFLSSVRPILPALNYSFLPSSKFSITRDNRNEEKNEEISALSAAIKKSASSSKTSSMDMRKVVYGCYEGFSPGLASYLLTLADIPIWFELADYWEGTDLRLAEKIWSSSLTLAERLFNGSYTPCILVDKNSHSTDDFNVFVDYFHICSDYSESIQEIISKDSINECIVEYYIGRSTKLQIKNRAQNIRKIVTNRISVLENKLFKLENELRTAEDCDYLKKCGELILTNMYNIQKGMNSIRVVDLYSSECEEIEIKLDIMMTPNENSQAYYKKYQKQRGAISLIENQISESKEELLYLENVLVSIDNSDDGSNMEEIAIELLGSGILKRSSFAPKGAKSKKQKAPKTTYLEYKLSSGLSAFAGKNNLQNDRLTLKESSNNDMWFHTKDIPGSHVVVKTLGNDLSPDDIKEAGAIAAWNSKGRMSGKIAVDYTQIRHVKKPSGAKPGMVIYTNNKTIYSMGTEDEIEKLRV